MMMIFIINEMQQRGNISVQSKILQIWICQCLI